MRPALLAALVAASCASAAPAPKPTPAPKPGIRIILSASPMVAQAPAHVRAKASVHDPQRELQCPSFTWIWGDGCESAWEQSCDPYGLPEHRPDLWTLWTIKPHVYHRPGDYDLALKVTAGDRTLRASVRLKVLGQTPGLIVDGGVR